MVKYSEEFGKPLYQLGHNRYLVGKLASSSSWKHLKTVPYGCLRPFVLRRDGHWCPLDSPSSTSLLNMLTEMAPTRLVGTLKLLTFTCFPGGNIKNINNHWRGTLTLRWSPLDVGLSVRGPSGIGLLSIISGTNWFIQSFSTFVPYPLFQVFGGRTLSTRQHYHVCDSPYMWVLFLPSLISSLLLAWVECNSRESEWGGWLQRAIR